jgi:hypothetical protein
MRNKRTLGLIDLRPNKAKLGKTKIVMDSASERVSKFLVANKIIAKICLQIFDSANFTNQVLSLRATKLSE